MSGPKINKTETQQENLGELKTPAAPPPAGIGMEEPKKSRKPRKDKGTSRKKNVVPILETDTDAKMTDLILEFQDKRRALREKYQKKLFALMDL